ncbi:MAG: hypothetical protein BJ554DRAFT_2673 [Olpidium bornovanus]|uniref:Uncharacterized protein n=1 Tax=Olpidium bornovanus TaxID=278681 RepID=A0A8H8DGG2_9FUNG|nr:MAG: hypothetical protein BJ554DRAFT_2673 [Olpidium bornovanus]
MGRYLNIPPPMPRTDCNSFLEAAADSGSGPPVPWWLDRKRYGKGRLTKKPRKIIIVNTLTNDECTLEVRGAGERAGSGGAFAGLTVCDEETMTAIQKRYLRYNSHAKGYMWKRLGAVLDMSQTLEENGIRDESDDMERVGMDIDDWLPRLHLYFADDLTVG